MSIGPPVMQCSRAKIITLERLMFTNWKTSAIGLISAFFAFVNYKPQYFPHFLQDIAMFVVIGGLAGLGLTAKDYNVTGGTKPYKKV